MDNTDRISVYIKSHGETGDGIYAETADVSPLGLILRPQDSSITFTIGDLVTLKITVDGEESNYTGVVLGNFSSDQSYLIRYCTSPAESLVDDRRGGNRWICPTNLLPKAIAPSPGRFNEFIEFQVRNISRSGLELHTGPEAGYLVTGMILNLAISLPLVGSVNLSAKVLRSTVVSVGGKDRLSLGSEIVSVSDSDRELLGQFLLQFTDLDSIEELRATSPTSREVTGLSYAKTSNDFLAILQRNFASFDLLNRIAIYGDISKPIAIASVTFPVRSGAANITRGSVRADQLVSVEDLHFEGDVSLDALENLLGNIVSNTLSIQRPYLQVSTSCVNSVVMSDLGFNEIAEETYLGHPIDSLVGGTAKVASWDIIWRKAADSFLQIDNSIVVGLQRRMYRAYKIIAPFARLLSRTEKRKSKTRILDR